MEMEVTIGSEREYRGAHGFHGQRILEEDVERDAVTNSNAGDVAGQHCIYIPPGDPYLEKYRTATYARFPETTPVFTIALSKAGFYYTGFKDRVKCFSCGMSAENWMIGDDEFSAQWHKTDCLMISGHDTRNVPSDSVYPILTKRRAGLRPVQAQQRNLTSQLSQYRDALPDRNPDLSHNDVTTQMQNFNIAAPTTYIPAIRFGTIHDQAHETLLRNLDLRKESDRRKTYIKWPIYPAPTLPWALAQNGLFYLGNLDRVQCYCCGGILRNWGSDDDVPQQHRSHFPGCRLFSTTTSEATGNIPMSEQERREANDRDQQRLNQLSLGDNDEIVEPPNPPLGEQRRLAAQYPLNNPSHEHMTSFHARVQSFRSGWPGRIRATVEQIAKAGFFYLGESDKTKCHYCNGGLQNWERNDEPWTEHAKWFPGCAFVIREKGIDFVKRQKELHPNLNRPTIRNSVGLDIPPHEDLPSPSHGLFANHEPLDVNAVRDMGFPIERIQRMMRRRVYTSVQTLIDDLLQENPSNEETSNAVSMHEAEEHPNSPQIAIASTSATTVPKRSNGASSSAEDSKKLRTNSPMQGIESSAAAREMENSLRAMKESERCKKCMLRPTDVVCIPCGHLAACSICAKDMKKCFICKTKVQTQMKVYRA